MQAEGRLSTRPFGRYGLAARELSGLAKADRDLDDDDRLGKKGHEREDVVRQEPDPGWRQKEDVGSDRRQHGSEQTRPAAAVPGRHNHRRREQEERMVRAKSAKDVLDDEGEGHRRDGNPVTDQYASITIHADVAGYRHHSLESAR